MARIQESKDAKELELKKMEQERWRKAEEEEDKDDKRTLKICLILGIAVMFVIFLGCKGFFG